MLAALLLCAGAASASSSADPLGTDDAGAASASGSAPFGAAAGAAGSASTPLKRVFLVPHTHDDPGWQQTIDEYYNPAPTGGTGKAPGPGDDYAKYHYGVKAIYDTVTELLSEPEGGRRRTFIVVETLFFSMWWEDTATSDAQRAAFRRLLELGQVEFVSGGWVMQDEISSNYDADIDQMTLGHKWLVDTFGLEHAPRVAWHIDPQGHVGATAARFAAMGFDAFIPNRIPNPVKSHLQNTSQLEFVWDGMASPMPAERRARSEIFTHVLDEYGYCPPNVPRNMYFWDDCPRPTPFSLALSITIILTLPPPHF